MSARPVVLEITAAGAAGAAVGSGVVNNKDGLRLVAVQVDLAAGQPGTVDVTISNAGRNLVVLTNVADGAIVYPKHAVHDAAGAAIAGRLEEAPICVTGAVQVDLAQANAAAPAAIVRLYFE